MWAHHTVGKDSGYWPTPTTQDNAQVRGEGKAVGNRRGTTLGGAVRKWPTPTQDTSNRTKRYAQGGLPLTMAVNLWPTPTAMTGGQGVAPSHKDGGHGWNIGAAVQDSLSDDPVKMWPTPTANEDACGKPTGKMQKMLGNHPDVRNTGSGTLNPTWVEWLMGWPIGWTDLEPLETDRLAEWLQSHGGY